MHRGDDRLAGAPQPLRLLVEVAATLGAGAHAVGTAAAEVGAGTKMLALGAQHDGAHVRHPVVRFQRVGDFRHHVGIDEIVRPAPDLDGGDDAGLADGDVVEAGLHDWFPALSLACTAWQPTLPLPVAGEGPQTGGNAHAGAPSRRRRHLLRGTWRGPADPAEPRLQRDLPHVGRPDRRIARPVPRHSVGHARPRPERRACRSRRLFRSRDGRRHGGTAARLRRGERGDRAGCRSAAICRWRSICATRRRCAR